MARRRRDNVVPRMGRGEAGVDERELDNRLCLFQDNRGKQLQFDQPSPIAVAPHDIAAPGVFTRLDSGNRLPSALLASSADVRHPFPAPHLSCCPEKPAQRLSRLTWPLSLLLRQILLHQHDRRRRTLDFAMTQESQNFPMITAALCHRNRSPLQRVLPARERNWLIFNDGNRLGRVHAPVSLSPEPKVNGSVYPNLGIGSTVPSGSINCAGSHRPSAKPFIARFQGVKPALSAGE